MAFLVGQAAGKVPGGRGRGYLFPILDSTIGIIKSFQPRNLWFPAEKPMVSRQETFKTHVALKLRDSHHGFSSDKTYERMQNLALSM